MAINQSALRIIEDLLFSHTGQQLTENRKWRVESALSLVFEKYDVDSIEQFATKLVTEKDPILVQDTIDALVNNETYFYRDRPTFDQLPKEILPELAERRKASKSLNIWSAGCSTGQEAHSLAMEFADKPEKWRNWSISILGTDISHKAIAAAKRATFSQFDVQRGLGISQLLKHFAEVPTGWQLSAEIRTATRFTTHNVIEAAPIRQKFDLILCRNVLLYFDPATRAKAFERLHDALKPDGFIMLGAGETVVGRTELFLPSGKRPSVFEPVPSKTLTDFAPAA
ncbi:MAG: protein-glutamate O-methyltransferase CheR [Erythrobacter sp.]